MVAETTLHPSDVGKTNYSIFFKPKMLLMLPISMLLKYCMCVKKRCIELPVKITVLCHTSDVSKWVEKCKFMSKALEFVGF